MNMENLPTKTEKQLRTDKLFDAIDLEGNKNSLVFEATTEINKRLEKFKDYIGVVPFGSQTIGYNLEGSDIDIDLLLVKRTEEIDDIVFAFVEEYKQKGVDVNFVPRFIENENGLHVYTMADLLAYARGPGIEFYRNWMCQEIKKLSPEQQEKFITNMTDIWINRDKMSFQKIKERIKDFDEVEYETKRRKLWENKIRNVLGHDQVKNDT